MRGECTIRCHDIVVGNWWLHLLHKILHHLHPLLLLQNLLLHVENALRSRAGCACRRGLRCHISERACIERLNRKQLGISRLTSIDRQVRFDFGRATMLNLWFGDMVQPRGQPSRK